MNIVYIILGWLFGILSPGITNKIYNHYKKESLKKVIISELKDIKIRLAGIPIEILSTYGILTVDVFNWVKEQTNNFNDFAYSDEHKEAFSRLISKEDIQIDNIVSRWNADKRKDDPAFHFAEMEISAIESNQINFDILDNEFLAKIFEIKFSIRAYNKEVENINEYVKMTFNGTISPENHKIVKKQIEMKNRLISEKAIFIIKEINRVILSEYK